MLTELINPLCFLKNTSFRSCLRHTEKTFWVSTFLTFHSSVSHPLTFFDAQSHSILLLGLLFLFFFWGVFDTTIFLIFHFQFPFFDFQKSKQHQNAALLNLVLDFFFKKQHINFDCYLLIQHGTKERYLCQTSWCILFTCFPFENQKKYKKRRIKRKRLKKRRKKKKLKKKLKKKRKKKRNLQSHPKRLHQRKKVSRK